MVAPVSLPVLPVQALTLNHRTAPAALRERVALGGDALRAALQAARHSHGLDRLVILATCQRVELYTARSVGQGTRETLIDWLATTAGLPTDAIASHAEYLEGVPVADHLCRVAAGLDATLLGEAQILAQVAGAIRVSVAEHSVSPVLKALFRTAVRAGEEARGTIWSRYPRTDIGSVAIDVATERLGGLEQRHAVVVGAGEVGELVLRALRSHGVRSMALVNRTLDHAETLGERLGATAHALHELPQLLAQTDLVVVGTTASGHIVHAETLAHAMRQRTGRSLVLVDAAMPRNVDPAVRAIDGVTLIDLEDLDPAITRARAERSSAVPLVEAIINDAVRALHDRYAVAPTAAVTHGHGPGHGPGHAPAHPVTPGLAQPAPIANG